MSARRTGVIIRLLAAAVLFAPALAWARERHDVVYSDSVAIVFLLGPFVLTGVLYALSGWLAIPKPPLRFAPIAAVVLAVWLAASGIWFVPAFRELFSSFGVDLPARTLILLQYPYLLLAPALGVFAALLLLRRHPQRGCYVAVIAGAESVLLVLVYFSLFIVVFRETVVG